MSCLQRSSQLAKQDYIDNLVDDLPVTGLLCAFSIVSMSSRRTDVSDQRSNHSVANGPLMTVPVLEVVVPHGAPGE